MYSLMFVLSSEQRSSGSAKFSQEANSCPLIMKAEIAGKTRHVTQEFLDYRQGMREAVHRAVMSWRRQTQRLVPLSTWRNTVTKLPLVSSLLSSIVNFTDWQDGSSRTK